jgi:putative tryptophan/tyrosine transport system substrate-binding protein
MVGISMLGEAISRRDFIKHAGGVAAAWPLSARAEQPKRIRGIGVLHPFADSDLEVRSWVNALKEALATLGWNDGLNVRIDVRGGGGDLDQMRNFARELIDLHENVLVAITTRSVNAVLAEAHTIPIVFTLVTDPVGQRLVETMARPGRDVTGFTPHEQSVGSKWVQILKEIAPETKRTTVMLNPDVAPYYRMYMSSMESAAATLAVKISEAHVRSRVEIEAAMSMLANEPDSALILMSDPFLGIHRDLIIALAAKYRLPAVYPYRLFVPDGGLISYGVDIVDIHRRAANYVDRILKGERAADLPVQTPSKYELAINLKTAKALGLSVPPTLLATADEVID